EFETLLEFRRVLFRSIDTHINAYRKYIYCIGYSICICSSYTILIKKKSVLNNKVIPFFGIAQIYFLSLAILAMFASRGSYILEHMKVIFTLLLTVWVFIVINYVVGRVVASYLKFTYEDSVSLNMIIISSNSPLSLAIAVTAFPDQPFIALALVIGPLIVLPVLAIDSQ